MTPATEESVPSTPEAAPRVAPVGRWLRFLPWLVAAAGAALLCYLLTLTAEGVFFSGDAGPKLVLVEQFARGDLHPDLRPSAAPWVKELWREGHFPFDEPFVYRVGDGYFASFDLTFALLTAPFYALFGWPAVFVWPVLGVLGTWALLWRAGRKLELGPSWTALALFSVAFASPLTLYGAMFWEHSLGVALALGGLTLLVAPALRSPNRNGLLAGLALGLSVWLRPEMVLVAAAVVALLPVAPRLGLEVRGRRAFVAGLALAALGLLAWNVAAYGNPFGLRTRPVVAQGASFGSGFKWISASHFALLAKDGLLVPIAGLLSIAALALRAGTSRVRGLIGLWWIVAAAFILALPILLPNHPGGDGGKQIGPRLLLVAFPIAALLLALSARALWGRANVPGRAVLAGAIAVALVLGVRFSSVAGSELLAQDYALRIAPTLRAAREDPSRTIVVTNQFVALEFGALFDSKQFIRVENMDGLVRVAIAAARAGERRFLIIGDPPPMRMEVPLLRGERPLSLRIWPIGCSGGVLWCLQDARLVSPSPP